MKQIRISKRPSLIWVGWFVFGAVLISCAKVRQPNHVGLVAPKTSVDGTRVIGRNNEFVVVRTGSNDTLESLAKTYLGDAAKQWTIGEFNHIKTVVPGQEVVIPLKATNPVGVYPNGYQTVPVLSYHHFAAGDFSRHKLEVSAKAFRKQLAYLRTNGYHVVRLTDLAAFMAGKQGLPRKSVVVTIDDGYKSAYSVAYPILLEFRFPATLFIYTDFVGTPGGLTWKQMKEMVSSGLIEIQPHSKSHRNLTEDSDIMERASYLREIEEEIRVSSELIEDRLGVRLHSFGYPYGDTNDIIVNKLKSYGYRLGATVRRGGNPAFGHPFRVRRAMVYGDDDITAFAKRLRVFHRINLK